MEGPDEMDKLVPTTRGKVSYIARQIGERLQTCMVSYRSERHKAIKVWVWSLESICLGDTHLADVYDAIKAYHPLDIVYVVCE